MKELLQKPWQELTKEEAKQIANYTWHDPAAFCRYFFPDFFGKPMPWLHRGILALLTGKTRFLWRYGEIDKIVSNFVFERDGETHSIFEVRRREIVLHKERFTLLILPRGFSKTTLAGVAYQLYNIVFGELNFAAYVSETARHAEMQLDNVKRQLEGNAKLKFFFGDLKPSMQDSQRWRQDFFETTTGMAMAARGRGGQVRGLNHNGTRPKTIIVDDVEDRESVATGEQREKTRTWAYADLQPALPMMDPSATMVALGTLLHPDSLLMTWSKDPQWTVIKFGAYDRQGELLWPENLDEVKLEREYRSAVVSNTTANFYMERHSEIRLDSNRDFQPSYFQYEAPTAGSIVFTTLYQDPAISPKEKADRCTFTVIGMAEKGKIYLLEQRGERGMKPRDQLDTLFELQKKWQPQRVGIESNSFQAALVHIANEEMFRRQQFFEIIPVLNVRKKEERIKAILQPRFAARYVYFAGAHPLLERELLEFPMAPHDDLADGLAGAVSLLDDAAFLGQDGDAGEEMPPLDEVVGDWRRAV